jgi:hypothetical protein
MSQYPGDDRGSAFPVILFGVGALAVIVFLFLPITDHARAVRKEAAISLGEKREQRKDEQLRLGPGGADVKKDKADKDKPSEKDEKKRAEEREAWAKEKKQLEE